MAGIQNLLANKGCYHITTSAVTGKEFFAVVIQEDSVITTLTGSKGTNYLSTYNLSGKTLKAGAYIPCTNEETIAAITMSSGSAIGYNQVG